MKITTKGKMINAKEFFPSEQSFSEFVKENNNKINVDCLEIKKLLEHIYINLVNAEGCVSLKKLYRRWIVPKLKFKNKNCYSINFWIERGWSEEYGKLEIRKQFLNRKSSWTEKRKEAKNNIEFNNECVEIRFRNISFLSISHPICNICNNKIELKKINYKNFNNVFYYKIIKCSNHKCESHFLSKRERCIAYLPKEIAANKIENDIANIKRSNIFCIESWIKKGYSEDEAKEKISNIQKKISNSSDNKNRFIASKENLRKNGYNEEQIKEICLTPTQKKFWTKKGYSEDEAIHKIKESQIKNSNVFAKKRKENPQIYSATTTSQIGYWTQKGYSEEESIAIIKERQKTFNMQKCIEKYGEEEGRKIYTERQNKWQNSLSKKIKIGYSKLSQELFYILLNYYKIDERDNIFFATHNREFRINRDEGGVWLYDFTDKKNKKIIEYNGDVFHANPQKYLSEDYPNPFKKSVRADEIWEKDKKKKQKASDSGFSVLVVWESEYKKNKENIIKKCLNFLNL